MQEPFAKAYKASATPNLWVYLMFEEALVTGSNCTHFVFYVQI